MVTRLTLCPVPPRWLFLRVDTDEGLTGWGEPVVEGRAAAAVAGSSSYRGSSGGRWTPERPGSRTDSWG